MAFSRVFVGVHDPHDVATGLVFGALVATAAVRVATGPVTRLTESMRTASAPAYARWLAGQGESRLPYRS